MSLSNAREAKSSHVSNQVLEEKSAPFNSYSILFQGGVPFRRYELPNWIFQGELANIEWRKTNSCPAVQVLAVKRNINSLGETRSIVCTEHITRTLAEISHLTIPEAIYTL